MKKLIYLLWLFAVMASLQVFGARIADPVEEGRVRKNFTAVASNVDGLPPVVHVEAIGGLYKRDIHMNDDGSQEPGATRMGELFADNLWDIIGLSEDFNYHEYIKNGIDQYYNASAHRGKIEQDNLDGAVEGYATKSVHMNTDGLCLLTRKKYTVSPSPDKEGDGTSLNKNGNNWGRWNTHYGYDDHEADGLILKGYRFYEVNLGGNLIVDVYIMHMDAGSYEEDGDRGDLDARSKQLQQVVQAIIASNTTHPILIIGDTNCRYTRDTLKADLIDPINNYNNHQFDIHDPWIDCIRDGIYPEYNTGSIMTSAEGQQRGEVVDKVWFINNNLSDCHIMYTYGNAADTFDYEYAEESTKKSYLHDESFTYADGRQIADHLPVVAYLTIEGPGAPDPEPMVIPSAPDKKSIVSGQTYYLRNKGSGKFLRSGGSWTTQAVVDDYPNKVIPKDLGGGKWALQTTINNSFLAKVDDEAQDNYYMDRPENEKEWTLTQVEDNVYVLTDRLGHNLTHNENALISAVNNDSSDPNQQWEFLEKGHLLNELYYTTSTNPKGATFLLSLADFCNNDKDSENGGWHLSSGNNAECSVFSSGNVSFLKAKNKNGKGTGWFGSDESSGRTWSFYQEISGLPAGIYEVSYQAVAWAVTADNHTFKIGGKDANYEGMFITSDPGVDDIVDKFSKGNYSNIIKLTLSDPDPANNKIKIEVDKTKTSTETGAYYDNFKIKCLSVDGVIDGTVYERVHQAIVDAQNKADNANLTHYTNGKIEALYNERNITGDGWDEIKYTYKKLAESTLAQKEIGSDYTYAIINPSFELYPDYKVSNYKINGGFPFGWSYPNLYATDSGVWEASNDNKLVNNADGEHIFNTWEEGVGGNAVYQDIVLTPGLYKLSAKVASDNGNKVYLFAGDRNVPVTTVGSAQLVPVTINFKISKSDPFRIGVAGEKNGAFAMEGGNWYKADDFHLERIGQEETIKGMEMLQLAINDVKAKSKNYGDKSEIDLSAYQAMIDNYTLTGDGTKEFNEVYTLLRNRVFDSSRRTPGAYFTDGIINNSFEWGNAYGWDVEYLDDVKVAPAKNDNTYQMSNADGNWLFNSYVGRGATILSQTITGLPSGKYELSAVAGNYAGEQMYMEIVSSKDVAPQRKIFTLSSNEKIGETITLPFSVAEGTTSFTINVGGCNLDGSIDGLGGRFYKVDNFQLKYVGNADLCVFYRRLNNALKDATKTVDGDRNADPPVEGLLPKYREQWPEMVSEFQGYIDDHLAGHADSEDDTSIDEEHRDPMGSNGVDEIKAIYTALRELVFSQTETGSDMTGAITNNSFETGDLTGWDYSGPSDQEVKVVYGNRDNVTNPDNTKEILPGQNYGTYKTAGVDDDYLFNCYVGTAGYPLTQTIPNVPAGHYKLTAKIASDNAYKFYLGANDSHSSLYSIKGDKGTFETIELEFTIDEQQDVKIGIYPSNAGEFSDDPTHKGPWYKVDDFRLLLTGRDVDIPWTMETNTHGTIILPFDVASEELERKGIEVYTITKSEVTKTPADYAVNAYHVLDFIKQSSIKANIPYVVKKVGQNQENTGDTYNFSGTTTNERDLYENIKDNLLTGVLYEYEAQNEDHHFTSDGDNVTFKLHDKNATHSTVEPYHAYIHYSFDENQEIITNFYFYEPIQEIKLYMEAEKYGTLILPFEAALPDDLKAYRITGVSEVRNRSITISEAGTYQLIKKEELMPNEDGVVILEENTPYLIEYLSTDRIEPITFKGRANNIGMHENSTEGNLLTGLFVSRDNSNDGYLDGGHWVLGFDKNGSPAFVKLSENGNHVLNAYNAYIAKPETVETPVTPAAVKAVSLLADGAEPIQLQADELLIDEPEVSENWTMDNQYVGTLVLPFDVDAQVLIDNDLKAYKITGVETEQTKNGVTYHILKRDESIEGLTANEAYMITSSGETQTVNFKGTAGASQTPVETGLMLGTYSPITAPENSYVANAEKGLDFKKVGADGAPVAKLHAYIPAASDLTGTYLVVNDDTVDVTEIMEGDVNVDIYTLDGVLVRRDVKAAEALQELDHGIYILRSAKGTVKVIK